MEPIELELIMLRHTLFDGLSFKKCADELGWNVKTVRSAWDHLLKKYPMLKETRVKWTNPLDFSKEKMRNPWRIGVWSERACDWIGEVKVKF